jgi:FkbM family methyltransferase
MDLAFNKTAGFTRWVVASGLLHEPFVVVDIGVQGGENPRWHLLGDRLVVHGFDAIKEVVVELKTENAGRANRHYHWIGAGDEDGEREFFQRIDDPCASSFWQPGEDRTRADGRPPWLRCRVQIRKLDTLLAVGVIPPADFLKVDVEGFEKQVFRGARALLASGVLGIETETNFGISPEYPASHFATVHELLLEHGFLVFDLNFNRIPRASFQQALRRAGRRSIMDHHSVGKPSTVVALFCRDLIDEADHSENYANRPVAATVDQIIKTMIIYELHGLNDVAVDTAERFRGQLAERLDVDRAVSLLADPYCRKSPPEPAPWRRSRIVAPLRALKRWRSWRILAPLRVLRRALRSIGRPRAESTRPDLRRRR